MTGKDATGRRWSIGELAAASGVTVRTLHHYDEIGLLRAGGRTTSGHRRYTEADLHRLYRIRALQSLGMSLQDIGDVVAGSPDDLVSMRTLLQAQLSDLRSRGQRIARLTLQVDGLLRQLDGPSVPASGHFMTTLEMISVLDNYFTHEQQEQLAQRRVEIGADSVDAARREWVGLVEDLLAHVRADTATDDQRVQELVRRWDELGDAFHSEGEQTKEAARRMWTEHTDELSRRLPWSADQLSALVGYIERVRQAR
ncbi:DNA-binding transcriptional regulator, MerR family [Actinopolymorpha cephalotaxi]|uniref:DNA-binding transcriptional MerR regulator n=1 Tax=Actinopolymorpha cephalotaxi TaxID=504797 RepID=A0A1I2N2M7_9ACTN|nr:MerR family transcriptional regulator [Actinopolymorpha cephalotaxi]NYH85710.1 DNA-binding transcriptional MerR regulator [Actinopolymorpha cephalotaxi]SFF98104.1 DNA-binding transcriptional regulator, MerR family [Actinopolymorpha cephalotaxi]